MRLGAGECHVLAKGIAADCAVQAHLAYLPLFFPEMDLSPYPVIQDVIRRTYVRPAYRHVMGLG